MGAVQRRLEADRMPLAIGAEKRKKLAEPSLLKTEWAPKMLIQTHTPAKAKKRGQLNLQDVGVKGSAPKSIRQAKFAVKESRRTTLKENIEETLRRGGGRQLHRHRRKEPRSASTLRKQSKQLPPRKGR